MPIRLHLLRLGLAWSRLCSVFLRKNPKNYDDLDLHGFFFTLLDDLWTRYLFSACFMIYSFLLYTSRPISFKLDSWQRHTFTNKSSLKKSMWSVRMGSNLSFKNWGYLTLTNVSVSLQIFTRSRVPNVMFHFSTIHCQRDGMRTRSEKPWIIWTRRSIVSWLDLIPISVIWKC